MTNHISNSPTLSVFEELLKPKYDLVDRLNDGTYGIVYKAIEHATGKVVAIKKIHHYKDYGLRCNIEPFIMSTIAHKNLIPAYDVLTHTSFTCVVMPLAKDDLFKYIRTHPSTVSVSQRIKWCWEVIQGLACLHQHNIIHGDLKSSNCLLMEEDMSVKLADFSLSLIDWNKHPHHHTVCTLTHRAPEVMFNKWSFSVDIWGLGCTLYEIMYGRSLFVNQGEGDDDQLNNKMLLCYRDWAKMTNQELSPQYIKSLGKKNLKYIPPANKFRDTEEYEAINDLILSMLQINPDNRPTVFQCMMHGVFQNKMNVYPFKLHQSSQLSLTEQPITPQELKDAIKICPNHISDLIVQFYHYLNSFQEISLLDPQLLSWVSVFILAKLLHVHMNAAPPVSWSQLINIDQFISNHILWRFPSFLLNNTC
jgi:serine/threonine protein kinase